MDMRIILGSEGFSPEQKKRAEELYDQLATVLSELNKIGAVQFLDWESDYVYNFYGMMYEKGQPGTGLDEDRLFVLISGEYDNLSVHRDTPILNSRGQLIRPGIPAGLLDEDE